MTIGIAPPKPDGSRRQSPKKTILKHFLKGILLGQSPAPKLKNLLTNHCRSLDAATPTLFTSIYKIQLQKAIVLRMQPGTKQPPLQCDLQTLNSDTP